MFDWLVDWLDGSYLNTVFSNTTRVETWLIVPVSQIAAYSVRVRGDAVGSIAQSPAARRRGHATKFRASIGATHSLDVGGACGAVAHGHRTNHCRTRARTFQRRVPDQDTA